MKTPKDFCSHPWGSLFRKSETESIAKNIMVILKRTGEQWRELSWEEYKEERMKDAKTDRGGGFSDGEKKYFDVAVPYTVSQEKAELVWK